MFCAKQKKSAQTPESLANKFCAMGTWPDKHQALLWGHCVESTGPTPAFLFSSTV